MDAWLTRNEREGAIMKTIFRFVICLIISFALTGCLPRIALFSGTGSPLDEYTLEGAGDKKVLIISVRGFLTDQPDKGWLKTTPSVVESVVSQLKKAEKDEDIRAVLFKIDTPGGTVTASDLLYHEIMGFKKRTGATVGVAMMDVATSGGYYISLPADFIMAHPTTVTGSVGVVLLQPRVDGLMEKMGVDVQVYKTGANKDMGSWFRESSEEEKRLFQDIISSLGDRFVELVKTHRQVDEARLSVITTARLFMPEEARRLGLIDHIGYLDDALSRVKKMAGLPTDARVIVYRKSEIPDDTIYNTTAGMAADAPIKLVDWPVLSRPLDTGFYYLWHPY